MVREIDWSGVPAEIVSFDAEPESEMVVRARELAELIHKDDRRKGGAPYFSHCKAVAGILRYFGADDELIAAGYLHDCVEDHPKAISLCDIEGKFGVDVREIVDGATKFSLESGAFGSDWDTLRKVAKKSTLDARVALLKLADRWHNLLTMDIDAISQESRRIKAEETLKFYIPLAKSFGLWEWAVHLADIAYRYFDPVGWAEVNQEINGDPRNQEGFKKKWADSLENLLLVKGIQGDIQEVKGGCYEMSEKRRRLSVKEEAGPADFREITDLVSFRIQLAEEADVFRVVSLIMNGYGRIIDYSKTDDYISRPSENGYRAFHLVLDLPEGLTEIAITTEEMEKFNRFGVLAKKWRGDQGWEKERKMLVFTPRQDLVVMSPGRRVVDLAYRLNPVLGLQMTGALIDGRMVGPEELLESGSSVEILSADQVNLQPDLDHLRYCSAQTAKVIRQQQEMWERRQTIAKGKIVLREILSSYGLLEIDDLDEMIRMGIFTALNCRGSDDLCFKLGYSPKYETEVTRVLQTSRLQIEKNYFTTIEIEGRRDKKGLSKILRETILSFGGSISCSVERVNRDGSFEIRVVMTGVSQPQKQELKQAVASNREFEKILVV